MNDTNRPPEVRYPTRGQDLELTGAYLLERRLELGLTQRQFARMIGVSSDRVSRWERDKKPLKVLDRTRWMIRYALKMDDGDHAAMPLVKIDRAIELSIQAEELKNQAKLAAIEAVKWAREAAPALLIKSVEIDAALAGDARQITPAEKLRRLRDLIAK